MSEYDGDVFRGIDSDAAGDNQPLDMYLSNAIRLQLGHLQRYGASRVSQNWATNQRGDLGLSDIEKAYSSLAPLCIASVPWFVGPWTETITVALEARSLFYDNTPGTTTIRLQVVHPGQGVEDFTEVELSSEDWTTVVIEHAARFELTTWTWVRIWVYQSDVRSKGLASPDSFFWDINPGILRLPLAYADRSGSGLTTPTNYTNQALVGAYAKSGVADMLVQWRDNSIDEVAPYQSADNSDYFPGVVAYRAPDGNIPSVLFIDNDGTGIVTSTPRVLVARAHMPYIQTRGFQLEEVRTRFLPEQRRYWAGDPVRGIDDGLLALTGQGVGSQPVCVHIGWPGKQTDGTEIAFEERWQYIPRAGGSGSTMESGLLDLYRAGIWLDEPGGKLRINIDVIAFFAFEPQPFSGPPDERLHSPPVYDSFEQLEEFAASGDWDFDVRLLEYQDGAGAPNIIASTSTTETVAHYGASATGLWPFLTQMYWRHNGESGHQYPTLKEGGLYPEDFALIHPVTIDLDLSSVTEAQIANGLELQISVDPSGTFDAGKAVDDAGATAAAASNSYLVMVGNPSTWRQL